MFSLMDSWPSWAREYVLVLILMVIVLLILRVWHWIFCLLPPLRRFNKNYPILALCCSAAVAFLSLFLWASLNASKPMPEDLFLSSMPEVQLKQDFQRSARVDLAEEIIRIAEQDPHEAAIFIRSIPDNLKFSGWFYTGVKGSKLGFFYIAALYLGMEGVEEMGAEILFSMSQDPDQVWAEPAARTLDNFRQLSGNPNAGAGGSDWYLNAVAARPEGPREVSPALFLDLSDHEAARTPREKFEKAKAQIELLNKYGSELLVETDQDTAKLVTKDLASSLNMLPFAESFFQITREMEPDTICALGTALHEQTERIIAYQYAALQGSRCGYFHMAELYHGKEETVKIARLLLEELIQRDPDDEWAERAGQILSLNR